MTVTLITRYVTYLVSLGRAYGTSLNHLTSLKHMYKLLGHELTWDCDYRYKLLLRGAKRHLGTPVKREAPITSHLLLKIAPLFDRENPLQAAMWALFLVAFYSFLRKSNLVVDSEALSNLKVWLHSDLYFDESFAYVTVCTSKTIRFQERIFSLPLPRIRGSLLCPVSALLDHLHINHVPSGAPLFSVWSKGHMHSVAYAHSSSFLT